MNVDEILRKVMGNSSAEKERPKRVLREETTRNTVDDKGNDIRTAFTTTDKGRKYGNQVVPADLGAKVFIEDKGGSELRLSRKGSVPRKIEL